MEQENGQDQTLQEKLQTLYTACDDGRKVIKSPRGRLEVLLFILKSCLDSMTTVTVNSAEDIKWRVLCIDALWAIESEKDSSIEKYAKYANYNPKFNEVRFLNYTHFIYFC